MHILLSTKDIGCELSDRTLFKALTLSIARGDRIGLIGRNGSGKSTLLKVLAGIVVPTAGRVESSGTVSYLPQLDFALFARAETVGAFLESRNLAWPLVRASLDRLFGATAITEEREVRALSGGELAKLFIAMTDTDTPDLLLLDEPTNHLDAEGLEVLQRYLLGFDGAFIVVSHDSLFLDHVVTSLWEIDHGTLTRFGGTYAAYQEQKRLADEARERDLEAARKEVQQARRAIEARETRTARAERTGRQKKGEPSRDKMASAFFKGQAEVTMGKLKRRQERALEERQEQVRQLHAPRRKTAHLDLAAGDERSRRMLIDVSGGTLRIGGQTLLDDITLRIEFGDRIVFTGRNGSGKSSLAKALLGPPGAPALEGVVKRSDHLDAVYLDQKYATVDPEASLLDNVRRANPHLGVPAARGQLGRFLFGAETLIRNPAGTLSGGETARLALAQATSRPIDLLVLDEPTNNLDIETLDVIADALDGFPGALVVISHNVRFLARLSIRRAYALADRRLKGMQTLPADEEAFYRELTGSR